MENARSGFDLENGNFWIEIDSPSEEIETEFFTRNGCEFSIFDDDEEDDIIHIEIDPDYMWSKEDVWELIGQLLYSVGEMDKKGNLLNREEQDCSCKNEIEEFLSILMPTITGKLEAIDEAISKLEAKNLNVVNNIDFDVTQEELKNMVSWISKTTREYIEEFNNSKSKVYWDIGNTTEYIPKANINSVVNFIHKGNIYKGTVETIHPAYKTKNVDEEFDQYVIVSNGILFHKSEEQILI